MVRSTACLYGLIVYLIFLVTFLYTIGFLGNILVPKSIDSGTPGPITASILVNLALLSLFALQHSIMARPAFKPVWTRMIPKVAERSTYVQVTCVALILIFLFWQPIPNLIWNFESSITGVTLNSLFWGGWLVVLSSTEEASGGAPELRQDRSLPTGPPSDHDRVPDCFLDRSEHVGEPFVVYACDDRLHHDRGSAIGGKRPDCQLRGRLSDLPERGSRLCPRVKAGAVT